MTSRVAPHARKYIKDLAFDEFDYKDINKAMGNHLYKIIKGCLYE